MLKNFHSSKAFAILFSYFIFHLSNKAHLLSAHFHIISFFFSCFSSFKSQIFFSRLIIFVCLRLCWKLKSKIQTQKKIHKNGWWSAWKKYKFSKAKQKKERKGHRENKKSIMLIKLTIFEITWRTRECWRKKNCSEDVAKLLPIKREDRKKGLWFHITRTNQQKWDTHDANTNFVLWSSFQ